MSHLHITQVKRRAGQSIVTSAAYRAGEKLYREYYGEVSGYTHDKPSEKGLKGLTAKADEL